MARTPGVGKRIADRLRAGGYVQASGKPDVGRFALLYGWDKTVLYEWIADRRTPTRELDRLSQDLGVTRSWLLFGEGPAPRGPLGRPRYAPIAGGSDLASVARYYVKAAAQQLAARYRRWWALGVEAQVTPAT
jgi:hypothetical protein